MVLVKAAGKSWTLNRVRQSAFVAATYDKVGFLLESRRIFVTPFPISFSQNAFPVEVF